MMRSETDAAMLELLAACEALAESHARTLKVAELLTDAALEGRSLNAAVLQAYQAQTERATTDVEQFRALVTLAKATFTVH